MINLIVIIHSLCANLLFMVDHQSKVTVLSVWSSCLLLNRISFQTLSLEILRSFVSLSNYFLSESHIYLFNELRNTYISIKNIFDFFKFVQVCNFKWKAFHTMNIGMYSSTYIKKSIFKRFLCFYSLIFRIARSILTGC